MEAIDKAIRLSPRDPSLWGFYEIKGEGYFVMRKDDRAIEWTQRSVAMVPIGDRDPYAMLMLASAFALSGQQAEAGEAIKAYLASNRAKAEPSASFKNSSWRWQIIRNGWPTTNGSLGVCDWQECPNEYDREARGRYCCKKSKIELRRKSR